MNITRERFAWSTEEEILQVERLLFTTPRSMAQIARLIGRELHFVSRINNREGIRNYDNPLHWVINPVYIPPDPKWRPYVES